MTDAEQLKLLKKKLNAWKRLALARERMIIAYRTGRTLPSTVLGTMDIAQRQLRAMGEIKA